MTVAGRAMSCGAERSGLGSSSRTCADASQNRINESVEAEGAEPRKLISFEMGRSLECLSYELALM